MKFLVEMLYADCLKILWAGTTELRLNEKKSRCFFWKEGAGKAETRPAGMQSTPLLRISEFSLTVLGWRGSQKINFPRSACSKSWKAWKPHAFPGPLGLGQTSQF